MNIFSISQASTCSAFNSALSPLCPTASYPHNKMFSPHFLWKFTLIWISATEHLGMRIRVLSANTNHRECLPGSWIDDGMAENQGAVVELLLNIANA